jgi:hypothetical protein
VVGNGVRRLKEAADSAAQMQQTSTNGWATEDHYRLLSVHLLVRTMHPGFAYALRWHLDPFHRDEPALGHSVVVDVWERQDVGEGALEESADAPRFVYFRDGRTRVDSLTGLLSFALWDVHALVPQTAQDFLFLHAGVVARDGAAILLLAPTDGGKSTLTTALLLEGFAYLSDELAAIDPVTETVYPYEKRISLDPEAMAYFPRLEDQLRDRGGLSARLRQRYVRPEDTGASVAEPCPVRSVIFLSPHRAGPPRLSDVTRATAVQRMVPQCFNLDRQQERGIVLLSRVAAGATAHLLEGGTPTERAVLLADHLFRNV